MRKKSSQTAQRKASASQPLLGLDLDGERVLRSGVLHKVRRPDGGQTRHTFKLYPGILLLEGDGGDAGNGAWYDLSHAMLAASAAGAAGVAGYRGHVSTEPSLS